MESKVKKFPIQTAHELSIETAKISFSANDSDSKLTPTEIAAKLGEYYNEAWKELFVPQADYSDPPT